MLSDVSAVYVFLCILGCVVGSFLNVLIDRLPEGKLPTGRSMCDFCNRVLSPLELIPVVSWFVQRGRSICCKTSLSFYYPLVEVTTGAAYVLLWRFWHPESFLQQMLMYILISAFIVIFFADLKYHIIPDFMTFVSAVIAVVLGRHILAGIGLSALFYLLYKVTKEKGLGFGDVKFAFPMGALLGFYNSLLALYIACVLGGLVGVALILLQQKKMKSMIAFGPFLILGTLVMLFFEKDIWALIHHLFLL